MNAKIILLRLAGLAVISALGWIAFAIAVHAMIITGLTANEPDGSFGTLLAQRTAFVWMGAVVLGIISVFIRENWRKVLYFAPLYSPPLFAFFQTIAS